MGFTKRLVAILSYAAMMYYLLDLKAYGELR